MSISERDVSSIKCSTIAPSTGPQTVPAPPIITTSSISTLRSTPKAMDGSTYRNVCAYSTPPVAVIAPDSASAWVLVRTRSMPSAAAASSFSRSATSLAPKRDRRSQNTTAIATDSRASATR